MVKGGFEIPRTVCITSDTYQEYVVRTGLRERILLELHRKAFKEMRWEEIWAGIIQYIQQIVKASG